MIIQTIACIIAIAEPPVEVAASAQTTAAPTTTATTTTTTATTDAAVVSEAAKPDRWILRHKPRAHELTLGVFGGIMAPARGLGVREPAATDREYATVAPEVGLRLGYYPSRFFGLEGELGLLPTRFGGDRAFLYAARAQAVLQAGWWRVVPFLSLGGGALGVASGAAVAGNDVKPALHFGGGLKINATKRLAVRVDVRDVVRASIVPGARVTHSPEALLSLELRFGVEPKPAPAPAGPPAVDTDADGIADADDWCSHEAGADPHGCPYRDGDCDGVKDDTDACPAERGVAPGGCPAPDRDGDTVDDTVDTCPDAAGPAPSGCPDSDGDGIAAPADRCPDQPETRNNIEDEDGCPDELPAEVQRFSGVIEGIRFDNNKATIRPDSQPLLDSAAQVLVNYPKLGLEIIGYTDDRGRREKNVDLSQRRADAVRDYLAGKGVQRERLRTRGAGPDEPVADNKTTVGRAANRRIEFRLDR